jgi:hypothetical protein
MLANTNSSILAPRDLLSIPVSRFLIKLAYPNLSLGPPLIATWTKNML